jgi:hypothetical protein
MLDDLVGSLKERIVAVAAEEHPGCRVVFEDKVDDFLHFDIKGRDGEPTSAGSPAYLAIAIADWSEEKFRYVFRQACGK